MDELKFTEYGDIILSENDDPEKVIDLIMKKYREVELGIGTGFSPEFISRAMYAGFYLTSTDFPLYLYDEFYDKIEKYYSLYNIWKIQTVLFFDNLHESKRLLRQSKKYEMRINYNLENIIDECIKTHGDIWVLPLKDALLEINKHKYNKVDVLSFELYKDNELKAGEFGIKTGKIYTSYSGFYKENSAGSIQLLLMLRYLRDSGFSFCNFGTDASLRNNLYKRKLGAKYVLRKKFIKLWREGRE